MDEFFKKCSPYLHVFVLVFSAGVAWAGVSANADQLEKLEERQARLEAAFIELRITHARIDESLKEIKRALRIKEQDHE